MTARARGSAMWASLNATGSCPAAAASSSVKLSTAKQFCSRPGVRIQLGRNGVPETRCITAFAAGMS